MSISFKSLLLTPGMQGLMKMFNRDIEIIHSVIMGMNNALNFVAVMPECSIVLQLFSMYVREKQEGLIFKIMCRVEKT